MINLILFFLALTLSAEAYSAEQFGKIDAVSGTASVSDKSGKTVQVSQGQNIYEGQTINTGGDGEVHLVTEDSGIIAVRPDSVFRIDEYKAEGSTADKIFMSLLRGSIRSITGWIGKHNSSGYRITTPTATIGIRGTDHETTIRDKSDGDEAGTYDNVYEGSTVVKTPQGSTEVTPGKYAFASRDKASAPYLLRQQPRFLLNRRLRIEERIQQRKSFLREHFEQHRENRIKHLQTVRAEHKKIETKRNEQSLEKRKELRKEIREKRREQAKRRIEAKKHNKKEGEDHPAAAHHNE